MLSHSVEKHIRKLRQKKYRYEFNQFIAEGPKVVEDLLEAGLRLKHLLTSDQGNWPVAEAVEVEPKKLKDLSQLETSNEVLAVFEFPQIHDSESPVKLILDKINDPGNLGTIVRSCDWFGVKQVYCTKGSVDVYNAKCVQSTMGSIARVKVEYLDDESIFQKTAGALLLVADLEGMDINQRKPSPKQTYLVMGNESHGPSDYWKHKGQKVTIPKQGNSEVESLNVAIATSILLSRLC